MVGQTSVSGHRTRDLCATTEGCATLMDDLSRMKFPYLSLLHQGQPQVNGLMNVFFENAYDTRCDSHECPKGKFYL